MKNCNECKWINITEQEQIDKVINHICLKYRIRVLHKSNTPRIFHNYIHPCEQCGGKSFEQR